MNNTRSRYALFSALLVVLGGTLSVSSQVPYDGAYLGEALRNPEYIILFTDRNIYAVNEQICFSSFYRHGPDLPEKSWSKVLYVELVTPSGTPVAKGKYRLNETGSSGTLQIPADATTGIYYLRSYTRWMQNFGSLSYCYTPLTIINPFTREVLTRNTESSGGDADLIRMSYPGFKCQANKASFAPGEEIRIELGRNGSDDTLPGEYCLTVVPAGMCDTLNAQVDNVNRWVSDDFRFNYLPEIRGVSISGSVVYIDDQAPAPRARLHFSSPGKPFDYFGTMTDDQGRFILTIPERTGTQEFLVACESTGDARTEIRIDQDFASDPIPFRTGQLTLSPLEKELASRMVINMQFSHIYKVKRTSPAPESDKNMSLPFYGKPTTSTKLSDFIKLPTMNEVFVNLVPDVFVYYNQGVPYLSIYSPSQSISLFPPLILIDGVPIFDQQDIFSIDPERIEKIEVLNDVYVRGGLIYGGMIFITTIQGDMAAVELPEGSYFFDYLAFHQGNIQIPYVPSERIPDTRNTLLWIDKIRLDPDETRTIQFYAPSGKGEYHLILRGISSLGDVVCGVGTFRVE